jgi:hypothetical protein
LKGHFQELQTPWKEGIHHFKIPDKQGSRIRKEESWDVWSVSDRRNFLKEGSDLRLSYKPILTGSLLQAFTFVHKVGIEKTL